MEENEQHPAAAADLPLEEMADEDDEELDEDGDGDEEDDDDSMGDMNDKYCRKEK